MPGLLEKLGTLWAVPSSQAHSFPPSPSSSLSLTHSRSNFSGSFMHLSVPSHAHSLMGELIHFFLYPFTHPANTS